MMSPFIHFFLSLLAALSMNLKYERKYLVILFLGFMGVLPDIDHLFPLQISGTEVFIFHNLNFLVLLPLALLLFISMFESFKGGHSSKYQRFALALAIILFGHLVLDIVAGNTIILQFSPEIIEFSLPESQILSLESFGTILSLSDLLLSFWIFCVIITNFIQTYLYHISEGITEELSEFGYPDVSYPFIDSDIQLTESI
ncbi:MAG: hypothetical protein KAS67_05075 [Thermoplasmata archaeon]|nr:hypothetical protein [Thermoplasmata archaeon]